MLMWNFVDEWRGPTKMTRLSAALAALLLILMPATRASAGQDLTTAMTGADLVAALGAAGLSATLMEDVETGLPVARVEAGDVLYFVRAMDCSGDACSTLLFFANFALGRVAGQADFAAVNAFNERQVFGRAYVISDRNEVGVDYVIEMSGGVSADNVARNIDTWADVITTFRNHFRASRTGL